MKLEVIVTSNNSSDFNPELLQADFAQNEMLISNLCYQQKSTDEDKIENIISAITSDSDVILAMRGGSGATRLMSSLRTLPVLTKEKQFVGYSDLTVLLNYLNKDCNFRCIHGPMAFELTTSQRIDKFRAALMQTDVIFDKPAKWLNKGVIEGQVVGGNLMLVTDSIGTFYAPQFKDKILLLEEIAEPLDKLDRMFAQLRDSDILANCRAIILGNFNDCGSQEEIVNLFEIYLKNLNIPVLYNLNLGHIDESDYIHLHTNLRIDECGIYYSKVEDES